VIGGSIGVCGACTASAQCAGYAEGYYGEVFCQPLNEDDEDFFCLQDCTEDASLCSDTHTCNDGGNCVPNEGEMCDIFECDLDHPAGACDEGQTCVDGECIETNSSSAHCEYVEPQDTMAIRLVKRGQTLVNDYLEATQTLNDFQGNDQDAYNQANRRFYQTRFYMRNHLDLLETLRATYSIFGQVY
jgi:hypothetical protein